MSDSPPIKDQAPPDQTHQRGRIFSLVTAPSSGQRQFNQIASIILAVLFGVHLLSALKDGNTGAVLIDGGIIGLLILWFLWQTFSQAPVEPEGKLRPAEQNEASSTPPSDDTHDQNSQKNFHLAPWRDTLPEPFSVGQVKGTGRSVGTLILIVVVLIFARAAGGAIGDWARSGSTDPSSLAQEFLGDESIREYVSSDFGFKASFPGFPTKETEFVDIQGYQVPITYYLRNIGDSADSYVAMVWDYSGMPVQSTDLSLEGALNGMAQNTPNGRLVRTSSSTLGGSTALEGHIVAADNGESYDTYARISIKGLRMYGVMTVGISYANFESFARSFTFTE